MPALTPTEENYLKAVYNIAESGQTPVSTNALADALDTKAASVTEMMKRLSEKGQVDYTPYRGVELTPQGNQLAKNLVRKHRLWEVFLVQKLHFSWDEVHPIAEQLEHIRAPILTQKLDEFLGFPRFDPHGDPIPDAEGNIAELDKVQLTELPPGRQAVVVGVRDSSRDFLRYLDRQGIGLGTEISVLEAFSYDHSMLIRVNDERQTTLSEQVCHNLYVRPQKA